MASVDDECRGEFEPTLGSTAQNVTCDATKVVEADEEDILELMRHTDTVVEIQNTFRENTKITLNKAEAVSNSNYHQIL